MVTKKRCDVEKNDCWNVEAMFQIEADFEKAFNQISSTSKPKFPKLASYKGKLANNPKIFKEAFEELLLLSRELTRLYTYAHLRHDEDITNNQFKVYYSQISSLMYDFAEESSWFEPELLSMPEHTLDKTMDALP